MVVYNDTGEVARDFEGQIYLAGRTKLFYDLDGLNKTIDHFYDGKTCVQNFISKRGIAM